MIPSRIGIRALELTWPVLPKTTGRLSYIYPGLEKNRGQEEGIETQAGRETFPHPENNSG